MAAPDIVFGDKQFWNGAFCEISAFQPYRLHACMRSNINLIVKYMQRRHDLAKQQIIQYPLVRVHVYINVEL